MWMKMPATTKAPCFCLILVFLLSPSRLVVQGQRMRGSMGQTFVPGKESSEDVALDQDDHHHHLVMERLAHNNKNEEHRLETCDQFFCTMGGIPCCDPAKRCTHIAVMGYEWNVCTFFDTPAPSPAPVSEVQVQIITTTSPSSSPSLVPSDRPSLSINPTAAPSSTFIPTQVPSDRPSLSLVPSVAPTTTQEPSPRPSAPPSTTQTPTQVPSTWPTEQPSFAPSFTPSLRPTQSSLPTTSFEPSQEPTNAPTPIVRSAVEVMLVDNKCATYGGLEFYLHDESTYYMKALRYVEATTTVDMPDWRICNRYGLACIWYATHRVATGYSNHMLTGLPVNYTVDWSNPWDMSVSNTDHECTWHGVECTNGDSGGNITEIDLHSNGLMGTFPNEVIIFKETLEVLDLEHNVLMYNMGWSKVWFLGELLNLRVLNLGNTAFGLGGHSDGLPSFFRHLTELTDLSIFSTFFFGPLDESIFVNLTSLVYLDMEGLLVDGPLPLTLKDLPALLYVYLGFSEFNGGLQDFFDGQGFLVLQELWMDDNPDVGGTIPSTMSNYTELASLSLSNCGLVGSVPSELGTGLSKMIQMWLYNNNLNGTIPTTLASMSLLERLMLYGNDLTGSMPNGLCINKQWGRLAVLGADCAGTATGTASPPPEIVCAHPSCCTCCGSSCTY